MAELEFSDVSKAGEDLLAFAAEDKPRFPTGFLGLDDNCGMIGPSELGLVWARSGSGKSTLLLNIVRNSPEVPTVVVNLEMTPRRQYEWLAAMTFDLPVAARHVEDTLRPDEHSEYRDEVVYALQKMGTHYPHLQFISSKQAPTVADLAMGVDILSEQTGTKLQRVFIDHLTLMQNARDYDGVQRTARELHEWAMASDLAVIAVQQTGRGGGTDGGRNDGHVPATLSSGVFGGEDAADWIWGMFRPERDPKFHKLETPGLLSAEKYEALEQEREAVRHLVLLQLIKNRPYGETKEYGVRLRYDSYSRRLQEGM